jgi:flagellar hook-basal body protein
MGLSADSVVGKRLFYASVDADGIDISVDSGLNISGYDSTTGVAKLTGELSVGDLGLISPIDLTLKNVLDMELSTPDGTKLAVQGTTNRVASDLILTATRSNVEVYASIDGVFYNYNDSKTISNKAAAPEVPGAGGGYQTVATMGFVGGRNIDSLIIDAADGKPVFSTITKLTTRVINGAQQNASSTISLIYNLDLSDTQLQASSFQVSQSVQDGEPRSQLASVSIDGDGTIVGVYGNGRQIVAGQIALAHFDASEQLVPTGGNSFAPSYRSGTEGDNGVRIGRPGEGSFGAIKSQAVEQSNVDLSNELVKLMLLQRIYSANSQSLRAFDQTMQDTIRMVG